MGLDDGKSVVFGAVIGVVIAAVFWSKLSRKRQYSITAADGSRKNYRCSKDLVVIPVAGVTTLYESFTRSCKLYKDKQCLGYRPTLEIVEEDIMVGKEKKKRKLFKMDEYKFITYGEAGEIAKHLGAGLRRIGLNPGDRVALYNDTRIEWTLIEQGCYSQRMSILTVYANLGIDGLEYALRQGEIQYLFTHETLLAQLVHVIEKLRDEGLVQHIILTKQEAMTKKEQDTVLANIKFLQQHGVEIITYDNLLALGRENPCEPVPPQPEDVSCIMYTSGSTGPPKGVMITHKNMVAALAGYNTVFEVNDTDVYLNYLPLAHVLALVVSNGILHKGLPIGIGTPWTLTDLAMKDCKGDFATLCPTLLAGVPMVYDRVKKGIEEKLVKASVFSRVFFNVAFHYKLFLRRLIGIDTPILNLLVFNQFRSALGGRCRLIVSGGAPLSSEVQQFLQICFSVPVLQGYGLTETSGAASVMELSDDTLKSVGPPAPCSEIKLVDVPDMGYRTTDRPYPRGEVWVRGANITKGYYQAPDKTAEVYTDDGWFKTGDIGAWLSNGSLAIVDRKKNLIKGPHGEYVALEKLEAVYKNSTFLKMICVYADTIREGNVAIVMPNEEKINRWAVEQGIPVEGIYNDRRLLSEIVKDCNIIGKENNLLRHETLSDVFICREEWTPDNQMLTAAFKLNRNEIYKNFKKEIDAMYARLAK